MKFVDWELVEDGDKYWTLLPLYNDWDSKTRFMSVGNTNVPEWDKLVEYCKNNKIETAHFFLDLIDAYEVQHKEGVRSDNYVGFFNEIISICFSDDEKFPKFHGFVGGDFCQAFYLNYVETYVLKTIPESQSVIQKIINKFKSHGNT